MDKIDLTRERAHVATLDHGSLQRRLGVKEVFGVAFGDVGSSIIYALGVVAALALGATPIALAITGVFFIFTALTYAELGATIPEAGGAQIFSRRAFNDLVSFLAGWALLMDYVLTAAISAYTIGPYLSQFFPLLEHTLPLLILAGVIMTILAGLNIYGIRESSRVSLVLSIVTIVTLGFMALYGIATVFDWHKFTSQMTIGTVPTWGDFAKAMVLAMIAYIGIEAATQLAGEARNPGKTVPQALKWCVIAVLGLYAGLTAVAMCVDGAPGKFQDEWLEQPLVGVASQLPHIGGILAGWIGVLAALVLFIATNAGLIGASRLAYSMSSVLQLPPFFSRLHPRRGTPWISILFFTAAAVAVVVATGAIAEASNMKVLEALAELYAFGSMLAFALAHLSLIGLRIKEPDLKRPFRIGGNLRIKGRDIPVTAVIGLVATSIAWIAVLFLHPHGRNLGFGWMVVGIIFYLTVRRKQELPLAHRVHIDKVAVPEFKKWKVKRILVPTLGGPNTETVQVACGLGREMDAEVTALYVIEIPQTLPLETFLADKLNHGDAALARAEAIGREAGVPVHPKLVQARTAARAILETAEELQCDLIVLGAMAGKPSSTAESVLHASKFRVWLCTTPPPEAPKPD